MNITRDNYEEFFMLYADNELTAAQRKLVEVFLAANPDLQQELEIFQQTKLSPEPLVFTGKQELLMALPGRLAIDEHNCESFFVLYADNELSPAEKAEIEDFVRCNPGVQESFSLMQQAKLSLDTTIVFKPKKSLYRYEKDERVIPFGWRRLGAAAAVLVFVSGMFWLNQHSRDSQAAIEGITDHISLTHAPSSPKTPVVKKAETEKENNRQDKIESSAIAAAAPKLPVPANPEKSLAALPKVEKKQPAVHNENPSAQRLRIPVVKNELALDNKRSTHVEPILHEPKAVEPNKNVIAAANTLPPDQPSIILHPDENETKPAYASFNNDHLEVLNTSVNTKSSLRGFLRKASRLIGKRTGSASEEEGRKAILVGGFEIAVR